MIQKTARNLLLALFISVGIIVYSFYTMTLLLGICASLLIITFTLFWSKNPPSLNEKNTPILKIGIVIGIGFIIYSFYIQTLVWGIIYAMFVMTITVLIVTLFRWVLLLGPELTQNCTWKSSCITEQHRQYRQLNSKHMSAGTSKSKQHASLSMIIPDDNNIILY